MTKLFYKILVSSLFGFLLTSELALAASVNAFSSINPESNFVSIKNKLAEILALTISFPPPPATYSLNVSKGGTGSGTVTSSPAGINCGNTCSYSTSISGTTLVLTAVPDSGATFSGWSGDCNGTGSCSVALNANKTVIASFSTSYDFAVQKTGINKGMLKTKTVFNNQPFDFNCGYNAYGFYTNGVWSDDCYYSGGPGWDSGTQITVYAEPEPFYSVFKGWTGCTPSVANPFFCSFTLGANTLVQANFGSAYSVTVAKKGNGDGTVNVVSPVGAQSLINCGNDCFEEFYATLGNEPSFTLVLGVVPDANSQLVGWDGCGDVFSGNCFIYSLYQKKVSAIFNRIPRTLTVNKSGTGSGIVVSDPAGIYCGSGADCSAKFGQGLPVILTAFKDAGSTFVGWTGCDSVSGTSCTVTMGVSNRTVTAQFNSL